MAPDTCAVAHEVRPRRKPGVQMRGPSSIEGSASQRGSGVCVLVVEDDVEMRRLVVELLSTRYRVIEAADGREGFARASREVPDLVVSDVIMPEWSGHDLVEALRREPRTRCIPVVLMSADVGEAGADHGPEAFVAKPFAADELFRCVHRQLECTLARTCSE